MFQLMAECVGATDASIGICNKVVALRHKDRSGYFQDKQEGEIDAADSVQIFGDAVDGAEIKREDVLSLLAWLCSFMDMRALDMHSCELGIGMLECIGRIGSLRKLSLVFCSVEPGSFRCLQGPGGWRS